MSTRNPWSVQLRLELKSGEVVPMDSSRCKSAHRYFSSLTWLNEDAHVYNVVYLASPEALEALKSVEDSWY